MSRIFLSHSSADETSVLALQAWLARNGWEDVFLDVDPTRGLLAGERWQEALRRANDRCEAVIFIVSLNWARSRWCQAEFLLAKTLNKRIFGVVVKTVPLTELPVEMTAEWQLCPLIGDGPVEEIDVVRNGTRNTVLFLEQGLRRLKVGLQQAGLSANYFPWPPPRDPLRTPYRGLEALDVHDAAVIFGRDAEILHGLDQLRAMRAEGANGTFVILGPSGAGKSSFLRAGLLPRLGRDDQHFAPLDVISPERGPLFGEAGLARALATANAQWGVGLQSAGDIKALFRSDFTQIAKLLGALQAAVDAAPSLGEPTRRPTVVLAVDQAEQLFDAGIRDESHAFLQQIGDVLRAPASHGHEQARARFIVIFTIRSDRYEPLQTAPELSGVASTLFNRLRPMSPAQFKEVITGPAARMTAGGSALSFEPALVDTLITDIPKEQIPSLSSV